MVTVMVVAVEAPVVAGRLRLHAAALSRSSSTNDCSPSARRRTCMPSGDEIDPLDQQPDDARLLGREQLIPQRRELGDRLDDVALGNGLVALPLRRRPCPGDDLGRAQQVPHLRNDRLFEFRRRHAPHRAFRVAAAGWRRWRRSSGRACRSSACATASSRGRRARRSGPAATPASARATAVAAGDGVLGEDRVDLVPGRAVDDRRVLAGMARPLVHRLAEVDAVVQDLVERALVDRLALAGACRPASSTTSWCGRRGAAPAPAWSPSRRAGTA